MAKEDKSKEKEAKKAEGSKEEDIHISTPYRRAKH